jgi:hypothetical protein
MRTPPHRAEARRRGQPTRGPEVPKRCVQSTARRTRQRDREAWPDRCHSDCSVCSDAHALNLAASATQVPNPHAATRSFRVGGALCSTAMLPASRSRRAGDFCISDSVACTANSCNRTRVSVGGTIAGADSDATMDCASTAASTALADLCDACHIDKGPRRWRRPSEHTPVLASFTLPTSSSDS